MPNPIQYINFDGSLYAIFPDSIKVSDDGGKTWSDIGGETLSDSQKIEITQDRFMVFYES